MEKTDNSFETPLLLGSQVFQFLKEQIISGKLEEGARLNELELQRTLGTSRTPIREAFRRLEAEGLVEFIPRRGAFVRSISTEEVREAAVVRASLEALALSLAGKRIDPAHLEDLSQLLDRMDEAIENGAIEEFTAAHWLFHNTLVELSGNQVLRRIYATVTEPFISQLFTYRYLKQLDHFEGVSHREIYELLASGRTAMGSRSIQKHAMAFVDSPPRRKAKTERPEKGAERFPPEGEEATTLIKEKDVHEREKR